MLRQLSIDELELIVPLFDAYRVFHKKKSVLCAAREFLRQRLLHKESVIFVAFEGEQAVGFT